MKGAVLLTVEDPDDRLFLMSERTKIKHAVQAFLDPTVPYKAVAEAAKEVAAACHRIYAFAIKSENFDLQLASRRLEDCSDEINKLVFNSGLREHFRP